MKFEFQHGIGDEVKIKDIDIKAHVTGLLYIETGTQYQVSYFYDGEPKTAWLYEFQLDTPTRPCPSFGIKE